MARTDNDSWEITESVGTTALGVAAARTVETESADPLISDPFARVFLDVVGEGVWSWYGNADLPAEVVEAEPELPLRMHGMVSYMASRTAFFDSFFLDAAGTGIRQAVILVARPRLGGVGDTDSRADDGLRSQVSRRSRKASRRICSYPRSE